MPKESRRDLFDRDYAIESIKSLSAPITLVLGLRRTGKSSVIRVSLNELKKPYIYLDLREFEERGYINYKDLLLKLQNEVNRLVGRYHGLLNYLKNISGIRILGNEVRFQWRGDDRVRLSQLLESLNDWSDDAVVVVFDEAQELMKLRGVDILPVLAYAYDNLKRIRFIISGSKMGLLYRFLRIENPESPLFGRYMNVVELKPFTRDEVREFLKRGFEELNIEFHDYDRVYDEIGGIPGWLIYFGLTYREVRDLEAALNRTLEYAKKLVINEFNSFLITREVAKSRYLTIMRTASKCSTWSEIKRALEVSEGVEVSDSELYNYLRQLIDSSWVMKMNEKYCPSEPLIGKAFSS